VPEANGLIDSEIHSTLFVKNLKRFADNHRKITGLGNVAAFAYGAGVIRYLTSTIRYVDDYQ